MALPVGTPSGCRSSTSIPSRMPRPESEIGSTWAIATAGTNASTAPFGTDDAEGVDGAVHRDQHRRLVGDRSDEHARRAPGLVAHAVDADVHRADEAHPVLVFGEAPGEARAGRRRQDHDRARRAWRPRSAARSTRGRPRAATARARSPTSERSGSATKPLRRSMHDRRERDVAGAGGLRRPAHAEDVAADRRRQHVAHELAGEVVPSEGARAARARRTPRAPAASATPRARSRRA